MKATTIFILLLCCMATIAMANGNKQLEFMPPHESNEKKPLQLSFAYFAESVLHPGFKAGVHYPIKLKSNSLKKREGNKTRTLFIGGGLTYYKHPGNHTGILIGSEFTYTKKRPKGFFYSTVIGLGYLRTFNAGTTYKVDEDGSVNKVGAAGRGYFAPTISFPIGWSINKSKKPIDLFISPTALIQMPYNTTIVPRIALEVGAKFDLK